MRVDSNLALQVNFGVQWFQTDLKKFKLHTVYLGTSEQTKTLQPVGQGRQAAEFQFESNFAPASSCLTVPVIWQSLQKAIQKFRGQNQWPSSLGSAQAQAGWAKG